MNTWYNVFELEEYSIINRLVVSCYYTLTMLSTVGYGDVTPKTWQGQIFVCVTIICGLIFIAMPLAIVGSTFGRVWDERQLLKLQRHLRQLLAENGIDPNDAVRAFQRMDISGDGTVSFDEFKRIMSGDKRVALV